MTAPAGSTDLLGKTASELQSDVVFGDTGVTGTLNYVTGYTGFDSSAELQSGNYIAFHSETTGVTGSTITVELTNSQTGIGPQPLDPDGLAVLRITDKAMQTIKIVASKDGYTNTVKEYSLAGLTLNQPQADNSDNPVG